MDTKKPSKERLVDITAVCKAQAAINKTAAGRPTTVVATDEVEKRLTAHPLVITKAEHLASVLALQFSLFERTQEESYLKAMVDTVGNIHSDLKYGPHTSTEGINAFMDFEEELTNELALLLISELKVSRYLYFLYLSQIHLH